MHPSVPRTAVTLAPTTNNTLTLNTGAHPSSNNNNSDNDSDNNSDNNDDNSKYKHVEYWDTRFEKETHYEWLGTFADFKTALSQCGKIDYNAPALRILFVGTGNSSFPYEFLLAMQHHNNPAIQFTNIDFSHIVVDAQRLRYPNMEWFVMDMTAMTFPLDKKFDYVIDKAAMDALVVDRGDPWDPNESTKTSVNNMLHCIANVLVPGGKFISIGFEQPIHRKIHFHRIFQLDARWIPQVNVQEVDVGMGYFVYCLSMKDADDASLR